MSRCCETCGWMQNGYTCLKADLKAVSSGSQNGYYDPDCWESEEVVQETMKQLEIEQIENKSW